MSEDSGGHSIYLDEKLPDYGAGRHCGRCQNVLRQSNPGPLCDPCRETLRARNRAATTAPPKAPPLSMRRSEVPDSEVTTRCGDVLTVLRDADWHPAAQVAEALGVSRQRVYAIVKRLREYGHKIDSEPSIGLHLVCEAPAPSAMVCCYTDAQTGQVTTVEAPPVCILPPFAGGTAPNHLPLSARFAEGAPMVVGIARSREVRIIEDLDDLDDEARGRVLAWAAARWASGS